MSFQICENILAETKDFKNSRWLEVPYEQEDRFDLSKLKYKLLLHKIPKEQLKDYLNDKNEGILIMVLNVTITSEVIVDS